MTGRVRRGSSPLWVAAGAVVAGGSTYVLLVVVARALGPVAYGEFSLFWAAVVIVSLGSFLPVEQVLARRTAGRPNDPRLLGQGMATAGVVAAVAVLVHTGVWLVKGAQHGGAVVAVMSLAFAVACAGFVLQFAARGVLAGRHALREYVIVIVVDAGLRAVVTIGLWLAGVTAVGAYASAVGGSALVCGAVGLWLARRTPQVRSEHGGPADDADASDRAPLASVSVGREVSRLVVAMLCMQALLNSGNVVAALAGTGQDAVVAGTVLAAITLARLPVFVLQSSQAAYVARIASLDRRGDHAGVRTVLRWLAVLVGSIAVVTVLVASVVGPAVVTVVFGGEYDVTRSAATLVAVGVGAYLVASVSNDVAVALGAHHRVGRAWVAGAAAAVLVSAAVPDLTLRATMPLLVGSVVAAGVLLPVVVARSRVRTPC